ncbi:hypothetical protein [Hymenobacter bucti]|uniref:Uncharacterized protein n=1 Tax=Hymenobacter bucti TaxID=1844114 RepID=A0ABW4R180_9BACT
MLFQPFVFKRGITLWSSVAMTPMTTWSSNNDLTISDEEARYYEVRVGSVSLLIEAGDDRSV